MLSKLVRPSGVFAFAIASLLVVTGCTAGDDDSGNPDTSSGSDETLYISGIPDQNVSTVNRQHTLLAEYMREQTGLTVEYVPMVDYAALVTAFERGDIHLAWFGALTGVQARALVEGSEAIAHRPIDAEFRSRFIVQADLLVESLEDLAGRDELTGRIIDSMIQFRENAMQWTDIGERAFAAGGEGARRIEPGGGPIEDAGSVCRGAMNGGGAWN
jgi:hypothetical protein